jgi:hypothetical protein
MPPATCCGPVGPSGLWPAQGKSDPLLKARDGPAAQT